MNRINLRIVQLKAIIFMTVFSTIGKIFKFKYWVLCERGTDARDNAYFFYKYLKKEHPEKKIYYIIDRHSADYEKVKLDVVQLGGLKFFWVMATADKIISSHNRPSYIFGSEFMYKWFIKNKNYYFLQHGVIKDDLKGLYSDKISVNLFVCGAKPEYDDVVKNYGHPDGVVQYTGLARYDNLHDFKVKNQILIMPTWRTYLTTESEFVESEYFKKWISVLSDEKLIAKLKDKNIELVFYPHYEMQKYIHLFNANYENVIIASFENYDVQTLLKESALLITDYSSVFFDFAYMRKPVLYFQFDKDKFYGEHYQKGYFDYDTMGFGEVLENEQDLVEHLLKYIEKDFEVDSVYKNRMTSFFPLHDTKNCERIYNCIIER